MNKINYTNERRGKSFLHIRLIPKKVFITSLKCNIILKAITITNERYTEM